MSNDLATDGTPETKAQQKRKTRRIDVARWKAQRRLRYGLYQPRSPKTMLHADRMANVFRRELEEAVLSQRGEIGIAAACQIQTAMLASRYAVFAAAMLRDEWDNMDAESRLAVHREILRGCKERDSVLVALDIDRRPDTLASLPAIPVFEPENE